MIYYAHIIIHEKSMLVTIKRTLHKVLISKYKFLVCLNKNILNFIFCVTERSRKLNSILYFYKSEIKILCFLQFIRNCNYLL